MPPGNSPAGGGCRRRNAGCSKAKARKELEPQDHDDKAPIRAAWRCLCNHRQQLDYPKALDRLRVCRANDKWDHYWAKRGLVATKYDYTLFL